MTQRSNRRRRQRWKRNAIEPLNYLTIPPLAVFQFMQEIEADLGCVDSYRRVRCGLHSGIPPCCVAFFIKVLAPISLLLPEKIKELDAIWEDEDHPLHDLLQIYDDYTGWGVGCGWHRCPCPACRLAKRHLPILHCDCDRSSRCEAIRQEHRDLLASFPRKHGRIVVPKQPIFQFPVPVYPDPDVLDVGALIADVTNGRGRYSADTTFD